MATVTITSDDDADKTAEITLAIACDSDITAPDAPAAAAATDGSHAFASVDIPTGKAGKCTFTATATLGGEEKSGEAEFTVGGNGDDSGSAIAVTSVKFYSDAALGTELTNAANDALVEASVAGTYVAIETDKDVDDATNISLTWACVESDGTTTIDVSAVTAGAVTMVGTDKKKFSGAIGDVLNDALSGTNAGPAKCTLTAKVGTDGTAGTGDLHITGA